MSTNPNRILIVAYRRIGDLILATPLLSAIRQKYPKSEITLLVRNYVYPFAQMITTVDKIAYVPKLNGGCNPKSFIFNFLFKKFDLCIDITFGDYKHPAQYTKLSGAKTKIGFLKHKYKNYYTEMVQDTHETHHILDAYKNMAKYLKAKYEYENFGLKISPTNQQKAQQAFEDLKIDKTKFKILIHPGNFNWTGKRWGEDKLLELTKKLANQKNVEIIYLFGPNEEKKAEIFIHKLNQISHNIKFFSGHNIETVSAFLQKMDMLFVFSTSIMHLGYVFNVPILCLLDIQDSKTWKPYKNPKGKELISKQMLSVSDIEVEKVWQTLKEIARI
ncbi:MAG: glycosyltransferase family 9 protein [Elusimicrobiaceae bacterium]|jgi:ADP-heptose:LPS heptosyltransferase|nr:glycosyltransferase family 9 protein [Elusimicrobiaceae bacterium]MBT3954958.1 glycosyltransferase family 9 protein [Elusimicrobiaceae bacterium]MBT4008608.1 glycosyltransferase family 9 protein [Elusimicrobiaceae bacterium]MBT4402954.1 glycosyltransferase family 9 protein [Elusimicrobiaceae bacterium]MBT4439774.1 glycosyltransferase family 9 protein [Elusimicrobiaceae bacterium]